MTAITRCAASMLALTILAGLVGCGMLKRKSHDWVPTPVGETPTGWTRYSPGECGLSIALPGELQPLNTPVPDSPQVVSVKNYIYKGGDMAILVSHGVSIDEAAVKAEAEGFFKGLGSTPTVSNMDYSIDPGTEERVSMRATYKQNGGSLGFEGFVDVRGKNSWVVGVVYQLGSATGLEIGKKALATASFDRPQCPDR
jgi:hypothetical protein